MDNQPNETFLSCESSRNIDKIAIEKYGIPGIVLMENAARGCVDWLVELGIKGPVLIVAGNGNNGGDGFAIARHLLVRGYQVSVAFFGDPNLLAGDAGINFQILKKVQENAILMNQQHNREKEGKGFDSVEFQSNLQQLKPEWIVDALLGTGSKGSLRSPFPEMLRAMNSYSARKFAVDLPSGMDGDSGSSLGEVFRADYTATFVSKKQGFQNPEASKNLGKVKVLDIGLPDTCWQ